MKIVYYIDAYGARTRIAKRKTLKRLVKRAWRAFMRPLTDEESFDMGVW